ncbi:hypothetical protein J2S67_001734 [Pseudoglutamicibacter albus]|uniref:Uncharacterized protein n=1 Tax=Pseudoglutamicibacter albus TaxID=98671 RepID=A0ABU1Z382_9MICC|nr:hypothetical protein [Pseudoglutamicibacter albus]
MTNVSPRLQLCLACEPLRPRSGSSPQARGTLAGDLVLGGLGRIIPAGAGNSEGHGTFKERLHEARNHTIRKVLCYFAAFAKKSQKSHCESAIIAPTSNR